MCAIWNGINFFPGIKRHESHCYIITSRCCVCMYCFYSVINVHWWKLCKQPKRIEYVIRVCICKIIWETLFIYCIYILSLSINTNAISLLKSFKLYSVIIVQHKKMISSVLMRFLCKTSHKDTCAWPCLTWHCQPIKSVEYDQWSPFRRLL